MEDIILVQNLCKTYEFFQLDNISFNVPSGCVVGFIGTNGSGKTTTIKCMLDLVKHTSGTVKIFGMDFKDHEQEIKDRIGFVFDNGSLYNKLTIEQMKSIVSKKYTNWDEEVFESYLKKFQLNKKQVIDTLSKGNKMKCSLAFALSHHAELLIMDEPTGGLDPLVRKQVLKILKEYMEQGGKGVFYSTHITSDLDQIADVIVMIHNGKLIFQEEKDILLNTYRTVKGPISIVEELNDIEFLSLEKNAYNFVGITKDYQAISEIYKDIVIEGLNIEDIMVAYASKEDDVC